MAQLSKLNILDLELNLDFYTNNNIQKLVYIVNWILFW